MVEGEPKWVNSPEAREGTIKEKRNGGKPQKIDGKIKGEDFLEERVKLSCNKKRRGLQGAARGRSENAETAGGVRGRRISATKLERGKTNRARGPGKTSAKAGQASYGREMAGRVSGQSDKDTRKKEQRISEKSTSG